MWDADDVRRFEVDQILKRIREIETTRRLLTNSELEEFNGLKERLYLKRKNCAHFYKVETLFNITQNVCVYCGAIDPKYNHYRDGK